MKRKGTCIPWQRWDEPNTCFLFSGWAVTVS
jgi:hypothetical protein